MNKIESNLEGSFSRGTCELSEKQCIQIARAICRGKSINESGDELVQLVGSGIENNNISAIAFWINQQSLSDYLTEDMHTSERTTWLGARLDYHLEEQALEMNYWA